MGNDTITLKQTHSTLIRKGIFARSVFKGYFIVVYTTQTESRFQGN